MSAKIVIFSICFSGLALGAETVKSALATTVVGDGVEKTQLRCVGRLNANTATREVLLQVPGLDAATVEAILEARVMAPIRDLASVPGIPDEARVHLKLDGNSNFMRLLQHPLQTFASR
jgi:DNA uptake protein ComE-like DNA-binding protein